MTDIASLLRLYLITDDTARSPADLTERVTRGLAGGATAVQFREKNCGPSMCARAFENIAAVCQEHEVPLFINADLIGRFEFNGPFAGFHYSDRTLPPRPGELATMSGYSAHAPEDAVSAFSHGTHFCTLSPIFPTPSKIGILDAIGVDAIAESRRLLPGKAIVALGGVDATNAETCLAAGASGLGVIRAIMAAPDPEIAARHLRALVEKYASS